MATMCRVHSTSVAGIVVVGCAHELQVAGSHISG